MCCKTMGIIEFQKPNDVWCTHCAIGKGCKIYDQRPPTCQIFSCMWLAIKNMPEELKPDKCKMVFTISSEDTVTVNVDVGRPDAWKSPVAQATMKKLTSDYKVLIKLGNTLRQYMPDGRVRIIPHSRIYVHEQGYSVDLEDWFEKGDWP